MSNIKELIRAEIERQMKYYDEKEQKAWDGSERGNEDALWYQGHRKMCAKLLSFLDNLPDEPVTDCHDLTEAAAFEYERTRNDLDARSDNEVARRAFEAGAEWMKTKMMDDAYEEEVQEVYQDDDGIHCCVSVGTDYKPGTIVYVITIPKEDEDE